MIAIIQSPEGIIAICFLSVIVLIAINAFPLKDCGPSVSGQPASTQPHPAHAGGIVWLPEIKGSEAFIAETKAAIDLLRGTDVFRIIKALKAISESKTHREDRIAECCVRSKTCIAFPKAWTRTTEEYSATIAHEAAHAHFEHKAGEQAEREAFTVENMARLQIGLPLKNVEEHIGYYKYWQNWRNTKARKAV